MSADGPDPSGDFGRGRSIVDHITGVHADVVGGALKVTSSGGGGPVDQGNPNTPANAWPVKPTDAAGVNQQAITVTGDAKITLDGEQVDVSDRVARKAGQVFLRNPGDTANMGDATTPVVTNVTNTPSVTSTGGNILALSSQQINGTQKTQLVGATGNVAV